MKIERVDEKPEIVGLDRKPTGYKHSERGKFFAGRPGLFPKTRLLPPAFCLLPSLTVAKTRYPIVTELFRLILSGDRKAIEYKFPAKKGRFRVKADTPPRKHP